VSEIPIGLSCKAALPKQLVISLQEVYLCCSRTKNTLHLLVEVGIGIWMKIWPSTRRSGMDLISGSVLYRASPENSLIV